jgi:hypothetical protein
MVFEQVVLSSLASDGSASLAAYQTIYTHLFSELLDPGFRQ